VERCHTFGERPADCRSAFDRDRWAETVKYAINPTVYETLSKGLWDIENGECQSKEQQRARNHFEIGMLPERVVIPPASVSQC
jgi:hypothetical protein